MNDLGAGNVNVDQPASELDRIDGQGFFRHGLVDTVVGDEGIDKVEIFTALSIEFHYAVVLDFDMGFGSLGLSMATRPTSTHSLMNPSLLTGRSASTSKRFCLLAIDLLP
jgi:hypothetical protein